MTRRTLATRLTASLTLAICPLALHAAPIFGDAKEAMMRQLAETYARSAVTTGRAVGVSVGISYQGRHYRFAYGLADVEGGVPATADSIYEMGSVTKIFTTAMLGQNVAAGMNSLSQTLGDFETQIAIGRLDPATRLVTLQDLGDFTAGLPSDPSGCYPEPPPQCGLAGRAPPPACIPNSRPTTEEYTASDFASYFQWYKAPPMPTSYCYSDISTGLIGLLLATPTDAPLPVDALDHWYSLLQSRIIAPLGLADTFLDIGTATDSQLLHLATCYNPTEAVRRSRRMPCSRSR